MGEKTVIRDTYCIKTQEVRLSKQPANVRRYAKNLEKTFKEFETGKIANPFQSDQDQYMLFLFDNLSRSQALYYKQCKTK